jgi:putative flippase GtrA
VIKKQFLSFALIGAAGFVVDTAILYSILAFGDFYYLGRAFSFLGAATFTWYLNRVFTFRDRAPDLLQQWWRFLVANSGGGLVNYLIYCLLIFTFQMVKDYPVLGVGIGALMGLIINFTLSRRFVFQSHADAGDSRR